MKKNNSLKKFNKLAKRVYKVSKKRDLGWKWQDAQKWTSANVYQQYKGVPISKIKVTEVDKNVIGILDSVELPFEMPIEVATPKSIQNCVPLSDIPSALLKDINWWMLADAIDLFQDNQDLRVSIGNIIDTDIVKKNQISDSQLKDAIEDMRKSGFGSDENIVFKILVRPNAEDDGKPCSYYILSTLSGSPLDIETTQKEIMTVVLKSDISDDVRAELEAKEKLRIDKVAEREAKKRAVDKKRPSKIEGQEEAQRKLIEENLKNIKDLYDKKLISQELYKLNIKELRKKLKDGGEI
jgi:hypothetical protein